MTTARRRRTTAIVPRSLLAGVSLGLGAIPLCIASVGSTGCDSSSVGIAPGTGDYDDDAGGDAAPVGIVPAMHFDAGSDAAPVGIYPAMDFDAGSDAADSGDP
jgi:hypothetical protein